MLDEVLSSVAFKIINLCEDSYQHIYLILTDDKTGLDSSGPLKKSSKAKIHGQSLAKNQLLCHTYPNNSLRRSQHDERKVTTQIAIIVFKS